MCISENMCCVLCIVYDCVLHSATVKIQIQKQQQQKCQNEACKYHLALSDTTSPTHHRPASLVQNGIKEYLDDVKMFYKVVGNFIGIKIRSGLADTV